MEKTKDHYLMQEYRESCINYPNINQNPRNHFSHLFFTNGNGIDWVDGNPVVWVKFNRDIPWKEYYRDTKPLSNMMEFFRDYMLEVEIEETFQRRKEFWETLPDYDEDKLWDKVRDDEVSIRENLYDLSLEEAQSKDFWVNTFQNIEHWPYLQLSNGYFDLQLLNKNTDPDLVKVAVAVSESYIEFYKNHKDIHKYEPPFGREWTDKEAQRCLDQKDKDVALIEKKIQELKDEISS